MLASSQETTGRSINGFILGETLGAGANAKVKIGRDSKTNQVVAIKILSLASSDKQAVEKECRIHSSLVHVNILRFFNSFIDNSHIYLILEYAVAGELFDRIAPDVGVGDELAHLYFIQLLSGMEYLHRKGNILLDENGNLKICDFGHATVFSHNGKVRVLTTPCGSAPYVAPEVLTMKYNGDSIDVWSAGIVLYVLLAGNTPWGAPIKSDPEYQYYLDNFQKTLTEYQWYQIPEQILELVVGILNPDPKIRFSIEKIKSHPWAKRSNKMLTNGRCNDPAALAKKMITRLQLAGEVFDNSQPVSYSQPEIISFDNFEDNLDYLTTGNHNLKYESFSQPQQSIYEPENLQFCDLLPADSLTRFYSNKGMRQIMDHLTKVLESLLVQVKINSRGRIFFATVDKRKSPLHGEILIQSVGNRKDFWLVRFKKSKGDTLEFKR
ncbi:Chk1 protein kinase, partial [Nowakowskiella sp. JEL0078]